MSDRGDASPGRELEQIYVVIGEGGEPQVAFDNEEAAEKQREEWRQPPVPIYSTVEPVELHHSVRTAGRVECPECEDGRLRVSDAIYADCDNCDAAVERHEVGL